MGCAAVVAVGGDAGGGLGTSMAAGGEGPSVVLLVAGWALLVSMGAGAVVEGLSVAARGPPSWWWEEVTPVAALLVHLLSNSTSAASSRGAARRKLFTRALTCSVVNVPLWVKECMMSAYDDRL